MKTDKQLKPIITWSQADLEPEDIDFEWDYLLGQLNEIIKETNPDGYWYCKVSNFGWLKKSGYAYLKFDNGKDMIRRVLPQCECSFNVYREGKTLKIQNYHHDSPTGNDWYELMPITYKQYEEQTI